ncbi:MAG: DUF5685 family protein [Oscillospiraceae bacterium]|jgi:hypothetical protein
MFGYIRPLKGELKLKEYESFRAVYCGLCHTLRRRHGFAARFVVNYDFTFMAMLLLGREEPCFENKRCPASPHRKKLCHCGGEALDTAADYSVILAYWKLKDSAADEGFVKALVARLASLLLYRAYRKARRQAADFDACVRENLASLAGLEEECCPSIDMTADKFAKILAAAASGLKDEKQRLILEHLFYHAGRIVYLLDAMDDLQEDIEKDGYNPLRYRFAPVEGLLSEENREEMLLTIRHSQNQIISAYNLLDTGPWGEILSNIIYLGLPWVTQMVFSGRWKDMKKGTQHGLINQ